ncbi:unnamed protein product [Phytophthora fragariaefolia]|uniref:Unnamed protein product n=1 Tax=Phytophthora fragariaefolia TaxID=1490495 RepID=A0A9W6XQV5_9STRA|nr:unnamed protein product [Phytophthora fragariaefolia]
MLPTAEHLNPGLVESPTASIEASTVAMASFMTSGFVRVCGGGGLAGGAGRGGGSRCVLLANSKLSSARAAPGAASPRRSQRTQSTCTSKRDIGRYNDCNQLQAWTSTDPKIRCSVRLGKNTCFGGVSDVTSSGIADV